MKLKFYISVLHICLLFCSGIYAQGFIIPSGAYVVGNGANIVLKNNFSNNGSFTHNSGTVIFAGTTQILNGSTATTFNNVTTISGSTTTIGSTGHKLKNVLLSNGTLNANGNLTLLSTATQTAAIDGSGTGEVLGNVIVQRYIASAFGYKYFSSPFQSDIVNDFASYVNLSASFPTFYKFDESLASNGWVIYTNTSGSLDPMKGYAANLGTSATPKTVSLTGVVNNHTQSLNLYNRNMAYTQGFNLVGNPYPSPVNWDAASGWTKTNIDNAVYYFNAGSTNQYTGVYSSYINGVSSDGVAGSTIAAMQGFFVHVSNGSFPVSGLLSINNNARIVNNTAKFFRVGGDSSEQSLVRVTAGLENAGISDAATFYFSDEATPAFNKTLDALKLLNTDSLIPSLFAVSKDAQKLSIEALTILRDTVKTIPLGLITRKDGWISFAAKDIKGISPGVHLYLTDRVGGTNTDLQKDSYRVMLAAGDYENRFFLHFSSKPLDGTTNTPASAASMLVYSTGRKLLVNPNLPAGEKANLAVMNAAGQQLVRQEISSNNFQPISSLFASGVYIVYLRSATRNQSKKIFIGNQ